MTFRVPSHNHFPDSLLSLVGGQLDSAVAEGVVVHLDHLAAWGSRKGPCTLVTPQRAPRPVSQLNLLLQERLKLKQEKLIGLVLSITLIHYLWTQSLCLPPGRQLSLLLPNLLSQVLLSLTGRLLGLGRGEFGRRQILINHSKPVHEIYEVCKIKLTSEEEEKTAARRQTCRGGTRGSQVSLSPSRPQLSGKVSHPCRSLSRPATAEIIIIKNA